MNRESTLWIVLGLAVGGYLLTRAGSNPQDAGAPSGGPTGFLTDPVGTVSDAVVGSLLGWKSVGSAARWLPVIAEAEVMNDLPTDLLARVAYQESHFRESIIRGTLGSTAGALGIMQLEPQFYPSVRVARPFTDNDVTTQIYDASNTLASDHAKFGSWPLALAAYNAGDGAVKKYNGIPPYTETQNYVAQIMADVPGLVA